MKKFILALAATVLAFNAQAEDYSCEGSTLDQDSVTIFSEKAFGTGDIVNIDYNGSVIESQLIDVYLGSDGYYDITFSYPGNSVVASVHCNFDPAD